MKVLRWVCHCEKHKGSGIHYHCGFKLREMRKWISVKERTQKSIIFHLNLLILNATISATTGMHVIKSLMWPTVKTTQTFRRQNLKPYYVPLQLQQSQQLIKLQNQVGYCHSNVISFIREHKIQSYTNLLPVVDKRQKESKKIWHNSYFHEQKEFISESISKPWCTDIAQKTLEGKNLTSWN